MGEGLGMLTVFLSQSLITYMTLTKNDLTQIDSRLDRQKGEITKKILEEVDKKINKSKYELFDKIDDQEEKYENLLTKFKNKFFEKVDPILKEVTTAREERPLIENRIEALEEIHPKGKHVSAT